MSESERAITRHSDVGAVVIGRNEGERLRRCLAGLRSQVAEIVYVDSGSTDGSAEFARQLGVHVVALDLDRPFTAARARNAGFHVLARDAQVKLVQFVDGDCEVEPGWIDGARSFLLAHPQAAVVFGRRRERFPERSIYNRLCDVEWHRPAGKQKSCGGDAMIRAEALSAAGGYRADFIAGEEPELCVRLRQSGWEIWCIDLPMTLHDAAMTHFSQWWRRSVRAGYAFVQGARLHGGAPEYHWVKETWRARVWGGAIPLAIVLSALLFSPYALLLALIYPAQIMRLYFKRRRADNMALSTSLFQVIGKFAEIIGQLKYEFDRLTGRAGKLIEYK